MEKRVVETGIVLYFENEEGKMRVEGRGNVPFHQQDGDSIEAGEREPRVSGKGLNHLPGPGDCLVILGFIRDRACPWGFFDEYQEAEQEIALRPVIYRVVKKNFYTGISYGPTNVLWTGSDLADLCRSFPPGDRRAISFQEKVGHKWRPCKDPRPPARVSRRIAA